MNKNLTFRNISNKSTKAFRGGTAQEQEHFELNLQLHAGVSNPYIFKITKNYKASADTKAAIPPYTEKSWTTPGTYTWTVPAGVTRVRVALCAGGGGGAGAATKSPSQSYTGGTGGNTVFGLYYTVTGGKGGYANKSGSCSAGAGGTPNGRNGSTRSGVSGHSTTTSGGTGWALNFNQTNGSYGGGGGAVASSYTSWLGGGGSGGYYTGYINVQRNEIIQITVGNYGVLGDTNDSRAHGYNGTSGFVLIAYGEGIE